MKERIQRFIQAFRMNGEVKKKTLIIGAIALAVIAAIILLACLSPKQPDKADTPDDSVITDKDEEQADADEPIVEPEDMRTTMEKYPDVYAWIEIPGTAAILGTNADVSYPVAQHPTNRNFYVDHDLDGNYSKTGTLFTEAEVEGMKANSLNFDDPVTIIYGHNMANRSMFGGMQTYANKLDLKEDQPVYIYQKDRRLTYQIVGSMMYDSTHILYYHDFANTEPGSAAGVTQGEEVFDNFFKSLWSGDYADTHVNADNIPVHGDKVLILLTCDNDTSNDNYRYLVICKLVEDTAEDKTAAK